MPKMLQRTAELLAVAVTLVAGYLHLEELGRLWLFWALAVMVILVMAGWYGRRKLRRLMRKLRSRLG